MNRVFFDILNNVSEGIIILDENLEILHWNNYMELITKANYQSVAGRIIYDVLPNFNKNYLKNAISDVLHTGFKLFFSAALHKNLVNNKDNLNLKISRFVDDDNSKFLVLEFIDITSQIIQIEKLKEKVNELSRVNKELQEKENLIKNLAYYDTLTGVANRLFFYENAEKALNKAKIDGHILCLMFIDVNKFKSINDRYGHEIGDKVLVAVAETLVSSTGKNDMVVRYGGDEFIILLPSINNLKDYEAIVSRIINTKNKIIIHNNEEINISLSIGISFYPNDGDSIDRLISKADNAMYNAKKSDGQDDCFHIA